MAWRRRDREPPRQEPPAWYRHFDLAAWDEPDGQEAAMISGSIGYRGFDPWPASLHEVHARRRWQEAKHAYRQDHPLFATQEFEDLLEENRRNWR